VLEVSGYGGVNLLRGDTSVLARPLTRALAGSWFTQPFLRVASNLSMDDVHEPLFRDLVLYLIAFFVCGSNEIFSSKLATKNTHHSEKLNFSSSRNLVSLKKNTLIYSGNILSHLLWQPHYSMPFNN
jgi:hypothetical protein